MREDQHEFGAADDLYLAAATSFEQAGNSHDAGRALLDRSAVLHHLGSNDAALSCLLSAAGKLDIDQDQLPPLRALFNGFLYLSAMGHHSYAYLGIVHSEAEFAYWFDELPYVRVRWLKGRCALAIGETSEAAVLFGEVRREFATREIVFDAALAALDEAKALTRLRRPLAVSALCRDMLPVFLRLKVAPEAREALELFVRAGQQMMVDEKRIEALLRQLEGAR